MKNYVIAILLFFCSISTYGQVCIGDNLNKIKTEDSTGTLQIDPNGKGFVYVYDNQEISTLFMYFLDLNYNCYATGVKPHTDEIAQHWTSNLDSNKDWKKRRHSTWVMKRRDFNVECTQSKDDKGNALFLFMAREK